MFINNGLNDEVVIPVAGLDSSNPNVNTFSINLSTNGIIGLIYKIKVRALNYEGSTDSNSLSVALASLPTQPISAPTSDPNLTNQKRIGVVIGLLNSPLNGGSPITIYQIDYDDGNLGNFSSVY